MFSLIEEMTYSDLYSVCMPGCSLEPQKKDIVTLKLDSTPSRALFVDFESHTYEDFLKRLQEGYNPEVSYAQGDLNGSVFSSQFMTGYACMIMLNKGVNVLDCEHEELSFSYINDQDELCGFSMSYFVNYPKYWIINMITDTLAPLDQRKVCVLSSVPAESQDKIPYVDDDIPPILSDSEGKVLQATSYSFDSLYTIIKERLNSESIFKNLNLEVIVAEKVDSEKFTKLQEKIKQQPTSPHIDQLNMRLLSDSDERTENWIFAGSSGDELKQQTKILAQYGEQYRRLQEECCLLRHAEKLEHDDPIAQLKYRELQFLRELKNLPSGLTNLQQFKFYQNGIHIYLEAMNKSVTLPEDMPDNMNIVTVRDLLNYDRNRALSIFTTFMVVTGCLVLPPLIIFVGLSVLMSWLEKGTLAFTFAPDSQTVTHAADKVMENLYISGNRNSFMHRSQGIITEVDSSKPEPEPMLNQ